MNSYLSALLLILSFNSTLLFAAKGEVVLQCNFKDSTLRDVTRYLFAVLNEPESEVPVLFSQEIEVEANEIHVICNNYYDKTTIEFESCPRQKDETLKSQLQRCTQESKAVTLKAQKTYGIHPSSKQTIFHQIKLGNGLNSAEQQEWWYGRNPRTSAIEEYDFTKPQAMECFFKE